MKQVALVTGGVRGIGLGISRALTREGWDLAVCGMRGPEAVQDAVRTLSASGGRVEYIRADISEPGDRQRLIDEVKHRFGRLDALVNNAGIAPKERRDILEATPESFEEVVDTNLKGPYFLTQLAARWMIEQRKSESGFSGCIIFVTSISSTVASINRGEYCISKAGLSMAAQLWAVRLADHGIPVYEVRPGVIDTDMTAGAKEKYDRLIGNGLLLQGRWGTPDDVGRAVAVLARGDLPYSTGQVIMVDGGYSVERL